MLPDLPCYLNGVYQPLAEAKVPVLDRGFMFGDGIYEVLPVYGQRIFRFDAHMDRLERSLAKLRIASPLLRTQWLALARELIERLGAADQTVYLQVTRGVAPRNHVMPLDIQPTVLAYASPLQAVGAAE